MALSVLNINVNWSWGTGPEAINTRPIYLLGFNVAISEDWVEHDIEENNIYLKKLKGNDIREHRFKNVLLDDTKAYKVWVQAEEIGGKSEWVGLEVTLPVVSDSAKIATYETIKRGIPE